MKKLFVLIVVLLFATSVTFAKTSQSLDVLPLMSSQSAQQNRLWVGTFQLAWNDLMDGIVNGPVKFTGGTPALVKALNKQTFKAEDLSESSYYKTYGETSPELKVEIETAIKEKFNETSDILDGMDWSKGEGKYTVYAMLKKDFKFMTAFDKLKPARFARSLSKVNFFGIGNNSEKILDDMVRVLFYNSSNDFAVAILTEGNDVLYLYRTSDNKSFDKLYADMQNKESEYMGNREFAPKDELKIPDINLYKMKSFDELCGHRIKGTDFEIDQAIETVDFKMNNEGVKLKSEALIMTKMTALLPTEVSKPRKFFFDDTFVMFLQEADKEQPYFALRVYDVSMINKTGK